MSVRACGNDSTNTICRGKKLKYTLKCVLSRRVNVSAGLGVEVKDKEMVLEKTTETNLSVSMNFYASNLYDVKASSPLKVIDHTLSLKSRSWLFHTLRHLQSIFIE